MLLYSFIGITSLRRSMILVFCQQKTPHLRFILSPKLCYGLQRDVVRQTWIILRQRTSINRRHCMRPCIRIKLNLMSWKRIWVFILLFISICLGKANKIKNSVHRLLSICRGTLNLTKKTVGQLWADVHPKPFWEQT